MSKKQTPYISPPCPDCGSTAVRVYRDGFWGLFVKCENPECCQPSGRPHFENVRDAVEDWKRRAGKERGQ